MSYTFLPQVKSALVAGSRAPGEAGVQRRVIPIDIGVEGNGARISDARLPIRLENEIYGAGDVISLVPDAIARVEPTQSSVGVEPNYFPYVEFFDVDFPWRLSLDTGNGSRVKPWLVLIALKADEFDFAARGAGPLPRIVVSTPAASLPELEQSWAFAHAHIKRVGDTPLDTLLQTRPDSHHSRLLCPRKLEESSVYFLFLVPTFEAGRLRGLGEEANVSPWDKLAWQDDGGSDLVLPIYWRSRITTRATEDFEHLVRRISLPDEDAVAVGGKTVIFSGRPGYYDGYDEPGESFLAEGALRQPGDRPVPRIIQQQQLTDNLAQSLNNVIGSQILPESDGPDKEDPLVALPPYGWRFVKADKIENRHRGAKAWLNAVNLDLRFRFGAGDGTRLVQGRQELFMKKSWAQVGDIIRANRLRGRLKLADTLSNRMMNKHFRKLPNDVALVLSQSLLGGLQVGGKSILGDMENKGMPGGYMVRSMRRLASKRAAKQSGVGKVTGKLLRLPGTPGVKAWNYGFASRGRKSDAFAASRVTLFANILAADRVVGDDSLVPNKRPVGGKALEVGKLDAGEYVAEIGDKLSKLARLKGQHLFKMLPASEKNSLDDILRGPRIPDPLADILCKENPDAILPNAGDIPYNSVALAEENKAFIESVMLGANHEMNRELRWREFPGDMRATVLPRFWDQGHPENDKSKDDISDIHRWTGRLGRHYRRTDDPALVLIIRGDLVRRYPGFSMVLNRQTVASGNDWEMPGEEQQKDPGIFLPQAFSGLIGDDIAYYGFDVSLDSLKEFLDQYYFLIFEPMGRPRFGLDIGSYSARRSKVNFQLVKAPFPVKGLARSSIRNESFEFSYKRLNKAPLNSAAGLDSWDDISWSHVEPTASGYVDFADTIPAPMDGEDLWGANRHSASLAKATMQKPVCAVIPADQLLPL